MCEYCDCTTEEEIGIRGERIGGREHGCYIMKLNKPINDNPYWIVEMEIFWHVNDEGHTDFTHKCHRTIPVNYCPVCGRCLINVSW